MAESKYYGIYQGIVTDINDPDKRGRLKMKCPDVLGGDTVSAWADPMIPVAYDYGGDFCMPQVEEAVWCMFIAGDANRPVWLGGWWQKSMTPLADNYSGLEDLRIISYADCTITMKKGIININVGAGVCDLEIIHNQVTVKGDLKVTGSVTAASVTAGSVHATVNEEGGAGTIDADTKVSVGGTKLNVP